jgi:hypothetical protein
MQTQRTTVSTFPYRHTLYTQNYTTRGIWGFEALVLESTILALNQGPLALEAASIPQHLWVIL